MIEFGYRYVDLGLSQVFATVKDMSDNPVVTSVGVLDNERTEGGIGNAELAAIHEFGMGDQKERSFLRATLALNMEQYRRRLGALLQHVIRGQMALSTAMDSVGAMMEADVRRRILSDIPPELQQATLDRKRAKGQPDTALIATGQLFAAIKHKVVRGKR